MKRKEDFLLVEMAGSYIVVPVGSSMVNFNAMMTLNETGAFLWEQLKTQKSFDDLLSAMCREFDIDQQTAKDDIQEFIQALQGAELLES